MKAEPSQKIYLYKRIAQAKLFIDAHFAEKIDLNAIADQAYFSKFHFIRLFKESFGYTPHNYLMQVRIEKAKLLLSENMAVADVSLAVGFESATSFTGRFKQLAGISPSEFQRIKQNYHSAAKSTPLRFVPNCFIHSHGLSQE